MVHIPSKNLIKDSLLKRILPSNVCRVASWGTVFYRNFLMMNDQFDQFGVPSYPKERAPICAKAFLVNGM